jgi:hypothetical protein
MRPDLIGAFCFLKLISQLLRTNIITAECIKSNSPNNFGPNPTSEAGLPGRTERCRK